MRGKTGEYRRDVSEVICDALAEVLKAPADDRFQIILQHDSAGLVIEPGRLGIKRSPDCSLIPVTLATGRSLEMEKAFDEFVAKELGNRLGARREDVVINLVEVPKKTPG